MNKTGRTPTQSLSGQLGFDGRSRCTRQSYFSVCDLRGKIFRVKE